MKKTILIVDDDNVSRELIQMVLEFEGHRCVEAADGESALAVLKDQKVDVMILDYMMPKCTGMEVLAALHRPSQSLSPPTIMVTGLLPPALRADATKLGVFAILEKPYDMGKLRELVAHLCSVPKESGSMTSLLPK